LVASRFALGEASSSSEQLTMIGQTRAEISHNAQLSSARVTPMDVSKHGTNVIADGIPIGTEHRLPPEAYHFLETGSFLRAKHWPRDTREDVYAEACIRCHATRDYKIILHYRKENYGTLPFKAAAECLQRNINSAYDIITLRRRQMRGKTVNIENLELTSPFQNLELCTDVTTALSQLTDMEMTIVNMKVHGHPLSKIAALLELTIHQTRRIHGTAIGKLRLLLRHYAPQGRGISFSPER
jgi:DNA-binding CsgD family transcriptional regulator